MAAAKVSARGWLRASSEQGLAATAVGAGGRRDDTRRGVPRSFSVPATRVAENGGRGGPGPREETSACYYGKNSMVQRISSGDLRQVWQKLSVSIKHFKHFFTCAPYTRLEKGSESKLTSESISNATTTNEQLRSLILDQRSRTRRDEFAGSRNCSQRHSMGKDYAEELKVIAVSLIAPTAIYGPKLRLLRERRDSKHTIRRPGNTVGAWLPVTGRYHQPITRRHHRRRCRRLPSRRPRDTSEQMPTGMVKRVLADTSNSYLWMFSMFLTAVISPFLHHPEVICLPLLPPRQKMIVSQISRVPMCGCSAGYRQQRFHHLCIISRYLIKSKATGRHDRDQGPYVRRVLCFVYQTL